MHGLCPQHPPTGALKDFPRQLLTPLVGKSQETDIGKQLEMMPVLRASGGPGSAGGQGGRMSSPVHANAA